MSTAEGRRCPLCGHYFDAQARTFRYCVTCWYNLFNMHLHYDGHGVATRAAIDADQPHPLIDRYYR